MIAVYRRRGNKNVAKLNIEYDKKLDTGVDNGASGYREVHVLIYISIRRMREWALIA